LVEFFKELPVVLKKCSPQLRSIVGDVELESALRVKELQTTLVCLTLLSKKYKVGCTAEYSSVLGPHGAAGRLC
jgi:hypothetical protein